MAVKTPGKPKRTAKSAATKVRAANRSAPTKPAAAVNASERIDRMIAGLADWRGAMLAEIRRLIREVDPEVIEDWKWMGTPVWSHDGMYALANAHKDKVKITFHHGARLRDPKKLFNAGLDGNQWRAIDLREGDTLDKPALKALLREAIAYNATHAVPRSKGSRPGTTAKDAPAARKGGASGAKPKLLSGGNPQIAKADGDAPVQAYIAAMPGWKSKVGGQLDALIVRTVPDVRKAVKWNSPFYGVEGRGWFLSFHTFTKYIKVAFFRGASLHPVPPGASKQKDVRYLDIREDEPIDEAQVAAWIRQAAALPGWVP